MTPPVRLALAGALLAALALAASRVQVAARLDTLLPADGPVAEALELTRGFSDANAILIEIDGVGAEPAALFAAADAVEAALRDDPLFSGVQGRFDPADGERMRRAALPHAVGLIPESRLAERISEPGLRRLLRSWLARLSGPGGALAERALASDPLELGLLALDGLRAGATPWRVRTDKGRLLDASGTRALLIAQPQADAFAGASAEVPPAVRRALAASPLPADWLGGHRHAAASEARIRGDVDRAALAGLGMVLIALVAVFRGLRPVVGAAIFTLFPVLGALAGAAAVSPVHPVAFAWLGALAGVAMDYHLHLQLAAGAHGPEAAWPRTRSSLGLALASSLVAFLALWPSSTPAVVSLGAMGVGALLAAAAAAPLLGPAFHLRFGPMQATLPSASLGRWGAVGVWGALGLAALAAPFARFEGDPRALIGAPPELAALEQRFADRYGGVGTTALAVLSDPDPDRLLDRAAAVASALRQLPGSTVTAPDAWLPGPARQAARVAALPPRELLKARFDAVADAEGFVPGVLDPALDALYAAPAPLRPSAWAGTPLEGATARHLHEEAGLHRLQIQVVLPDLGLLSTARALALGADPEVRVAALGALASEGVASLRAELVGRGGLAAALIVVLLAVVLRSWRAVAVALLPVAGALLGASAVMALAGLPWNSVSLCGMVLVLGLGLDYGVFVASGGGEPHTRAAVAISALTTLLGFAGLTFADSPAVRGLGLAVVGGLGLAVALALVVLPRLLAGEPSLGPAGRRWVRRLALVGALAVIADAGLRLRAVCPPPPIPADAAPDPGPWTGTWDDRRVPGGHLKRVAGLWALKLEGRPYDRGRAGGRLTDDLHLALEEDTKAEFERVVPNALARFALLRGVYALVPRIDRHFPEDLRLEMRGWSDGATDADPWLGPLYTRKAYYHALHDLGQAVADAPFVEACTGFVAGPEATAEGHWMLARNFDFDGGAVFDRDKVVTVVRPEEGLAFLSVSFASFMGVVSGVNEAGLAVAVHSAGSDAGLRVATPMTLVTRQVLQHARDLDQAEAILDRGRGFVAEIVVVVDSVRGEAAAFEITPDRVVRRPLGPRAGVANHFLSPELANDQENQRRQAELTTAARQARVDALLAQAPPLDLPAAVAILSDRAAANGAPLPPGHRHALNADIATHGVVIDASARRVWVSRYPKLAGGWVAFDLPAILAGALDGAEVLPADRPDRTLAVLRARELLWQARRASPLEAERLAARALELAPGHPEGLIERGAALVALGRPEEARPLLEAALATPPEYPEQATRARALLEGR